MADSEPPAWSLLLVLTVAGLLLIGFGATLGLIYCEYRRSGEVQQRASNEQQIIRLADRLTVIDSINAINLVDLAKAAVVYARNDRPRSVIVSAPARDTVREHRWTTPP